MSDNEAQSDQQETDALSFSFRLKSKPSNIPVRRIEDISEETSLPVIPSLDDEYYKTNHKNRGIAVIFNHLWFEKPGYGERKGTEKDCAKIVKTLKRLGFDTRVHQDLKYGQIEEELKKVSLLDHSDNDCLVVVAMSHGDPDVIHARDEAYYVNSLWEHFTGDKCPTLTGKPKLFFIQACRGTDTDDGVEVQFDGTPMCSNNIMKIPAMADILIMYATPFGNYSFRSPQNGSWFIQALCKELENKAKTHDVIRILTGVNRVMSFNHASYVPGNRELHNKKQVGQIVSSLTRILHFCRDVAAT